MHHLDSFACDISPAQPIATLIADATQAMGNWCIQVRSTFDQKYCHSLPVAYRLIDQSQGA
jgi:hypothetical protein